MKKVATRYAIALFQLAQEAGEKEQYYKDLTQIKKWMLGSSNFRVLLENPLLPQEMARQSISKICTQGKASQGLSNFLHLIVDKRRLNALPAIIDAFIEIYNADQNILTGGIETAHPLTTDLEDSFKAVLEARFKTKLILNYKVNAALLGGFRAKVGAHQIDSSLMTQLTNLSRTLKGAS